MCADTAPAPDLIPLHGEIGVLAYGEVADRIQCHVCGRWLQKIELRHLALHNLTIPLSRHHIELVEYEHPRGAAIPLPTNSPGVGHWAFVVDDIHAEVTRLKGLGVRFKSESPNLITEGVNRGGYTIYFLDPDGITLEFMQPPA